MDLENSLTLEIICADISTLFKNLNRMSITVKNIQRMDQLTVRLSIHPKDLAAIQKIAQKQSAEIFLIERQGIKQTLASLLKRPVLMICIFIIILLTAFLPTRVLFVEATGMQSLSSKYILEKAAECGIRFGASRREVRSEEIKNKLLAVAPELHWAGVNTYGCIAVITVEEKSVNNNDEINNGQIASVVAAHDGVITACTVQKGTQLCRVGQAVKAGEVLVSGYTDSGIMLRGTLAEAEITAKTIRRVDAISLLSNQVRSGEVQKSKKISLQIGKKLIKLFKGSGICGGSCVKMYSTKSMALPGGRVLPIAVIIEQHEEYSHLSEQTATMFADHDLQRMAEIYLRSQMIAGEIVQSSTEVNYANDYCLILGTYSCTETIGRVIFEERIEDYG